MRALRYAALLVPEVRPGICGEAPRANAGVVGIAAVVFSEVFLPVALRHETVSGRGGGGERERRSYTNRHMHGERLPNAASMQENHLEKKKTQNLKDTLSQAS